MRMLEVECGDMLEVLRGLPDNSMDSCVTDPPYELSDGSKQSPCRVAAKVLLPDNTNTEAEAPGECELVSLALEVARLGGVDFLPGPTASVPVVSVTLDEQTANGQEQVEDCGPLAADRISDTDGAFDTEAQQLEYLGDFRLELADPETLIDALNCAGTGFFAGGIGIGFGIRPPLGPRLGSGRFVVDDGHADVWALYDSLPAGVGAGLGTEHESVARLDVRGGTKETLSARAALVFLGVCQTAGAKLVRASTAACGLPPVLQPTRVRFIVCAADRALAFDVKVHCLSLTQTGFMSKAWDGSKIAFDVAAWREVFRVLKPGAHIVAFGGTRTWHRIAVAIEDAGFQIRDSLAWIYGQGMPKSLNLSKAIDKAAGAEREVVGSRILTGSAAMSTEEKGGTYASNTDSRGRSKEVPVTASATELAKKWEGWGTALKPCIEPIILARKPLIGTIAANVAKYGVGGLNIDACRTPLDEPKQKANGNIGGYQGSDTGEYVKGTGRQYTMEGRWPPNVCVDEDVAADLDETNGTHPSAPYKGGPKQKRGQLFDLDEIAPGGYSDKGGVSRYFYCPKAASGERDAGLTQWPPISGADATNSEEGQARLKNGRTGAGRSSTGQDEEEWEIWVNEDRKAVLRVAMGASQPRVIDESTTSDRDATEWSTFLFGNDTTDPCLMGSKCTIETKSSSTTESRILNYLAALLTSESTAAALSRMESSTSPVVSAELRNPCLDIIVGKTVSLPGVGPVASGTRLRISVGEKRKHARRCFHPTVKPLALMRWLCRLVTPPGGFILDPFAGSGTTGCAAALEGFHFAGIELDPMHTRLAMDRIMHWAR